MFYQGVEIRTQEAGAPASGRVGLAQEEGTPWIDGKGWSLVSDGHLSHEACDELFSLAELPIVAANRAGKSWAKDKGRQCFGFGGVDSIRQWLPYFFRKGLIMRSQ